MTDTQPEAHAPEATPFAVPTRPVMDGIVDPLWGQWVHDRHLALAHGRFASTTLAGGYINIGSATLGLASVTGGVASVVNANPGTPDNGAFFVSPTTVAGAPSFLSVRIMAIYGTPGGPASFNWVGVGTALTLNVIAWGTPTAGTLLRDGDRAEIQPTDDDEGGE